MKNILLILLLIVITSTGVFSLDSALINDPQLLELFKAQQDNNQAWAANEIFLETGDLKYDISRSMLVPQVDAGLTGSGFNSFLSRIPAEPADFEMRNNYSISATPEISLSQLLPTAGVVTGSISDTVTGSGLKESNYPLQPEHNIEFSNKLDIAVGISQPLFFGGAYKASLTQINEARELNYISYLDNRNALMYSAVSDYYALIQSAYQKELIAKRLETNLQYEKRMLREHQLGMWTKAQLNTAVAVRLQSEADLLKAVRALESAKEKIRTLYGMDIDTDGLNSEISEFAFDTDGFQLLNAELLKNNPEMLKSLKAILIADSEIILKQKDASATLTAGGVYTVSNSLEDNTFADNLSFSLGISMPVIDGKAASKTITLKQKEAEQQRNNYADQQKRIISQLQSLIDNISVSKKLSEIYILQEEAAVFDVEKGIKELELGGITQKDLLEIQISLENTRLTILLNKIEFNLTVLQIYRLLGNDLALLAGTQKGAY